MKDERTEETLRAVVRRLDLIRPELAPRFGVFPPRELLVGIVDGYLVALQRAVTVGMGRWRVTVMAEGLPRGLRLRSGMGALQARRWKRVTCAGRELAVRAANMMGLDDYLTAARVAAICKGPDGIAVVRGTVRCSLPKDVTADDLVAAVRDAVDVARALDTDEG